MTTDLDAELRAALHDVTAGVVASPTLLEDVRHDGRRRRIRRRVIGCTAVVAAALLVVGGAGSSGWPLADSHPAADRPDPTAVDASFEGMFTRPTRGDLAGDRGYVAAARAAWERADFVAGRRVGAAHVLWAGRTAVGRAAVVVQRISGRGPDRGTGFALGITGSNPARDGAIGGELTARDQVYAIPVPDAGERVVLVVDLGRKIEASTGRRYTADAVAYRTFAPVAMTDGVGLVNVPARGLGTLMLRIVDGQATRMFGSAHEESTLLGWSSGGGKACWPAGDHPGDAPVPVGVQATFESARPTVAPERDREYLHTARWCAYGTTVDGRRVVVLENALLGDPSRVWAVVSSGRNRPVAVGRMTRPGEVLPVLIPLPDPGGWFVARQGATFRYRSSGGAWVSAGSNAALLPPSAAEVEVTAGATVRTVPLR